MQNERQKVLKALSCCADKKWANALIDAGSNLDAANWQVLAAVSGESDISVEKALDRFNLAVSLFVGLLDQRNKDPEKFRIDKNALSAAQDDDEARIIRSKVYDALNEHDYAKAMRMIENRQDFYSCEFLEERMISLCSNPFANGKIGEGKELLKTIISVLRKKVPTMEGFCATPLDVAVNYYYSVGTMSGRMNNRPAAMTLIEEGADVNAIIADGGTMKGKNNSLLHYVIKVYPSDRAIIKAIIKAGHRLDVINTENISVVDCFTDDDREEWANKFLASIESDKISKATPESKAPPVKKKRSGFVRV